VLQEFQQLKRQIFQLAKQGPDRTRMRLLVVASPTGLYSNARVLDYLEQRIENIARIWLGSTKKCA
jgi:hypothetical protein